MDEEWQLLIELDAEGSLAAAADELIAELGDEIGIHRAGEHLVTYAKSEGDARAAEHHLRHALERRGLGHLDSSIKRWDHEEQEWRSADGDDRMRDPMKDASWLVSASVPHVRDALRLARELMAEGYDVLPGLKSLEIKTASRHDAEMAAIEVELRAPGAKAEVTAR